MKSSAPPSDDNSSEFQQALRDLNKFERDNPGWSDAPDYDEKGGIYARLYRNAQEVSGLDEDEFEAWEENLG